MDTKRKYHEATEQTIRFFENVLDATEDGILITDFSNSIILVNQNFASIFGETVKEMLETNLFVWLERVDPDAPKTWTLLFDRIHRKEAVKRFEYSVRERFFEINGTMVDIGGDSQAVLWVWRDVSEHKLAEETLKKNEEKYRNIFENIQDVYYEVTLDGIILEVSPSIEALSHYKQEEIIGRSLYDIYVDPGKREELIKELLKNGKVTDYEILLQDKDGSQNYCSITAKLVIDKRDNLAKIIGSMHDIHKRKQAEDRIRNLSQMLMQAQERERQMISYELHDRIAQNLSWLKISLDTFFKEHSGISPELIEKMKEFSNLTEQTIIAVRDLSCDLRPPGLDAMGLVTELGIYCDEFSEKTGLEIDFQAAGLEALNLTDDTKIHLYRLIQEGLNNIRKHADAVKVTIKLVGASPNIILRIEDDGKGFDVKTRELALNNEKRMGLRSMQERVNLVQGRMTIKSHQMKGTKVFIKLPYVEQGNGEKKISKR